MFVGFKGIFICSIYVCDFYIVGWENDFFKVINELCCVEISYEMDWVCVCKEDKSSCMEVFFYFGYFVLLNEVVVMGNLVICLQDFKCKLEWDGVNMKIINIVDDEEIWVVFFDKFMVVDGDLCFDMQYVIINVKQVMEEYIKCLYCKGWNY